MSDIEKTLAERGARYGDFTDRANLAQALQSTMRAVPGWQRLTPDKAQALTVITDKIARILSGDPEYTDNWHDIAGYAKLAEDRCRDTQTADMFQEPDDATTSAVNARIEDFETVYRGEDATPLKYKEYR